VLRRSRRRGPAGPEPSARPRDTTRPRDPTSANAKDFDEQRDPTLLTRRRAPDATRRGRRRRARRVLRVGPAASPAGADESPFRKLHKLLRGRYLLAFVLGLIGAGGGAAAGYLSQKPAFKAEGLIEIRPVVVRSDEDKIMVMFSQYIQSQMGMLLSDTLIRQAMRDARWQKVRPGPVTDAGVSAFMDNLTVGPPKNSNVMIQVAYSEKTPDAETVCPAAVQSLIDAYKAEYDKTDALNINVRIAALEKQDRDINARIAAKRQLIQKWSAVTDGTDTTQLQYLIGDLTKKEQELSQARESIAAAEQSLKAGAFRKPTPEDWARVDTTMSSKIKLRDDLQLIIGSLTAQARAARETPGGPQPPERADALNGDDREEEGPGARRQVHHPAGTSTGTGGTVVPKDLTYLREAETRMADEFEPRGNATVTSCREVGGARSTRPRRRSRSPGTARPQIATDQR
jgi:hypothetical protein